MAFNADHLILALEGYYSHPAFQRWVYKSAVDQLADINAPNYFNNAAAAGKVLKASDEIRVSIVNDIDNPTTSTSYMLEVIGTAGGVITTAIVGVGPQWIVFNDNILVREEGIPNFSVNSANNIVVGNGAMAAATDAFANVAIGSDAMGAMTTNHSSVAVGHVAHQHSNSLAATALGAFALRGREASPHTGFCDTAVGEAAGIHIQGAANQNTIVAFNAGFGLTTGANNCLYGVGAGFFQTAVDNNAIFGTSAYHWGIGTNQAWFGNTAGNGVSTSCDVTGPVAQGAFVYPVSDTTIFSVGGYCNPPGSDSTQIKVTAINVGVSITLDTAAPSALAYPNPSTGLPFTITSILSPPSGGDNCGFGRFAGTSISGTAQRNTVLGSSAGFGLTTGSDCIYLGYQAALAATTGSRNFVVGSSKALSSPTASDEINIEDAIYATGTNGGTTRVGINVRPTTDTLEVGGTLKTTGAASFGGPVKLPSYTVGTLPSAATAGQMIYVSNESGGAVTAFSDGTNWRRVTDRFIVS